MHIGQLGTFPIYLDQVHLQTAYRQGFLLLNPNSPKTTTQESQG